LQSTTPKSIQRECVVRGCLHQTRACATGLYREAKRASRQWIVQQLGGAPDGIATQDSRAVEVWREVLQRTGIRQCDMRLDDNAPAKEGADPQQERRRLALVHGMRVGKIRRAMEKARQSRKQTERMGRARRHGMLHIDRFPV